MSNMHRIRLLILLAGTAWGLLGALGGAVGVDANAWAQGRLKSPDSGVTVSFTGGAVTPLADTADTHQQGLVMGLRMGYMSRRGLGLDVGALYTPLPRQALGSERYETHLASLLLLPRYGLNVNRWRLWLGAGGGLSYEHVRLLDDSGGDAVSSESTVTPTVLASVGVEYHLVTGIGLVAEGRYTRVLGALDYQLAAIAGGVVLTFR